MWHSLLLHHPLLVWCAALAVGFVAGVIGTLPWVFNGINSAIGSHVI